MTNIVAKPLPATAAIKYDIVGRGLVCVVNIQITSHTAAEDSAPAGAETIKYHLGRLAAAIESELHLIQGQENEVSH